MPSTNEHDGRPAAAAVVRTPLLTAGIEGTKSVDHVEVMRIVMSPDQRSGLHLHPCPVIGVVTHGSVLFGAEGEPSRVLLPGDAFYEPANARIAHFDAQENGATFVAHYLLSHGESELITMLA